MGAYRAPTEGNPLEAVGTFGAILISIWSAVTAARALKHREAPVIDIQFVVRRPNLNESETADPWRDPAVRITNNGPYDYDQVTVELMGAPESAPVGSQVDRPALLFPPCRGRRALRVQQEPGAWASLSRAIREARGHHQSRCLRCHPDISSHLPEGRDVELEADVAGRCPARDPSGTTTTDGHLLLAVSHHRCQLLHGLPLHARQDA
jgi:hypothetical protein